MKEKEMKEETTVIFIDEGTIDLEELNSIEDGIEEEKGDAE